MDKRIFIYIDGKVLLESRHIAALVLGKPIPDDAVVHHADGNPANNKTENLVICENRAYHIFIHQRIRAFDATGDVAKRKCTICKKWDSQINLIKDRTSFLHPACERMRGRQRYSKNTKKVLARCHKYYVQNREKINARNRAYYWANRDAILSRQRLRYQMQKGK